MNFALILLRDLQELSKIVVRQAVLDTVAPEKSSRNACERAKRRPMETPRYKRRQSM